MTKNFLYGAVAMVMAVCSGSVYAAPISGLGAPITDPALTGGVAIDFDSAPAGEYNSFSQGAVTITGQDGPVTIGSDYNGQYNTSGGQSMYNGFDFSPTSIRFDFAASADAFGFNWGASNEIWMLSAFDAANNLLEQIALPILTSRNRGEYFGIATAGIAYATLVNQGGDDYVFVDNFTYLIHRDVPEPAAFGLLALGLLSTGFCARSRKKKSPRHL